MSLTLADLFASPDHYLHSFEGDAALFMPMDREAYHRSIFLDGRISPAANRSMRLPIKSLRGAAPKPAVTSWIFHVAHCGSTLLARALDQLSLNLVLREPLALRQIAIAPDRDRFALVTAMLSKRYRAETPTLVKANVPVNFILPDLIAANPGARAVFLHCGLRDYLLAILRSDNHRDWMRRVTTQLAPHIGDLSSLPDAERAAALWTAQMRAFAAAMADLPQARSLDAERFFASPRPVLAAAAKHLQVPLADQQIATIVNGPLFSTYSKNPEVAFDNQARMQRRAEVEAALGPELLQSERWVAARKSEIAPALDRIKHAALES